MSEQAVNLISLCSLAALRTPAGPCDTRSPTLCRARAGLMDVLLDQWPSLLTLRHRLLDFVRMTHRYFAAVRLLNYVHADRAA
jgi:hypothetical protein